MEINYLSGEMESSGWDVWLGLVLGLSTVAASASGSMLTSPFTTGGLLAAVGATLGGLKVAYDENFQPKMRDILKNEPMSYGVFVEEEFS